MAECTLQVSCCRCLQEKFAGLDRDCQETVRRYTKIESRNPYLHPTVSKACSNLIERKCGLEAKAGDGGGVMECLVRHKMDHPQGSKGAMNNRCRTVVDQWQILTLQDWKFSFKFKEACKSDIREHCKDPRPTKKEHVISCLVETVAADAVSEEKQSNRISKACRAELKFELLQKHSSAKLDPDLERACQDDLSKFCRQESQDGGLECLKSHKHKDLSRACRKVIFQEEREEAEDADTDFALMRGCSREVREHCGDADSNDVLRCLTDFSHDNNFDPKCLNIVRKRIMQRSRDYRLQPGLKKACGKDISRLCQTEITSLTGDEVRQESDARMYKYVTAIFVTG